MARLSWMKKAGRRAQAQASSQKIVEEAAKKCTHPLKEMCACKIAAAEAVCAAVARRSK